jgi:disulfide bond formation protein DsbB
VSNKNWWRLGFFFILFIASAAIGLSYYAEHVEKIPPCFLCHLQRLPYFILIPLSSLALLFGWQRKGFLAIQSLLLVSFFVATYHTLVKYQILPEPLFEENMPSMKEWYILGLPAPLYNSAISLFLFLRGRVFLRCMRKKEENKDE